MPGARPAHGPSLDASRQLDSFSVTERTVVKNLAALEDGPVTVRGWVDTVRDQKKVQFVVLRDESGALQLVNPRNDDTAEGVRLTNVESGGPASAAGLEAGDVVTSIDGKVVTNMQELIVTIRTHRPGERVTLQYERGGSKRQAEVTLGSKEG